MRESRRHLTIAYIHYGEQSGVTASVTEALEARGHRVIPVFGRGPLELRDRVTGRPRVTPAVLLHLAAAAARFGDRALGYRWNTPFAFDVHSGFVGEMLAGLPLAPDVVLQNGALFAPGRPPLRPYVVYLDHTRALAERHGAEPAAGLPAPPAWGEAWRAREGETYRGAAALAAFSRHAARSAVEDYGAAAERTHVVGAGANVLPREVERADDGETVLFVGRDFERKGGPVLLDAFVRLRRARPRARLLVVGPRRLRLMPEGVLQLGPEPLEALPGLFARASVFALPALREPFGLAFLDAMACAVPCVGTRVEAIPELVEHGRTGLLVPPADPVALAAALERLLARRDEARAMGARGRERVLARFTWSEVARRLGDVLAEALRGAGPRAGSARGRPAGRAGRPARDGEGRDQHPFLG
ncbi:glycosyltransferase family 4 protein [Anaeromyxobacter diazotrophicus]|uniref:glycosyltransferase family 4 protein n=1 Tax=Anaeromyxobacter diazotrophicus TaxID=2590199 RepID=UPI0015922D07|nr:glycosyltransferase family 4 protein [Anaeromyxobacter diazotrophicus]